MGGVIDESGCLGLHSKVADNLQLKLNTGERPIANKYCEGKMKRTLEKRSKELEIVKREANKRGASEGGLERRWGEIGRVLIRLLRWLEVSAYVPPRALGQAL